MLLAPYIASRLSLRRDADGARRRSPGTVIAVAGIALAIAIMILAVAVVTGFKQEIRERVLGFNAPVTVYPSDAFDDSGTSQGIRLNDTLAAIIGNALPDAEVSLAMRQSAILKTDNAFQGIVLRSSDSDATRRFIESHLTEGTNLPLDVEADSARNTMVISRTTARALGVSPGDRINVHFLRDNNIATRRLRVTGIYDSHFGEYDKLFAFTPQAFLQRLNRVDSLTGTSIELRGLAPYDAPYDAHTLDAALLQQGLQTDGRRTYIVDNVIDSCALYFNWLDLLDTNVVVIIVLMALVASFTLISSLFIIILERVGMIGLLKALGATNSQIRSIFILLAERLVLRGLIWGNVIGIGLLLLEHHFHFLPLDPESYYLDYVPVCLDWGSVILINLCAVAVSFVVLLLPSQLIARLSPASTMRFE